MKSRKGEDCMKHIFSRETELRYVYTDIGRLGTVVGSNCSYRVPYPIRINLYDISTTVYYL
jgi:hypothetical protein